MEINPVATFFCEKLYPQDAAKQASRDPSENLGEIRFQPGFEQALEDLEGFSHLWLIYQFHLNQNWHAKVLPPRGSKTKRGVFATRSPYRPNSLGLSCVEFIKKTGLSLWVKNYDLLDGTPIFDIKPYLNYADSFPDARRGWLEGLREYPLFFSEAALQQLAFLGENGVSELRAFIENQLSCEPLNKKQKRLLALQANSAVLAYRTWRVHFSVSEDLVHIHSISSGYSPTEISSSEDPYGDKILHQKFVAEFQTAKPAFS